MSIKVNNNGISEFDKHLEVVDQFLEQVMLKSAEDGLNVARDASLQTSPYMDRTGNLRASTGYTVIKDSVVVTDSVFDTVAGSENGRKGIQEGTKYLDQVKSQAGDGSKIIFVAGMDYAGEVELNHDVLTGASIETSRQLYRLLKRRFK